MSTTEDQIPAGSILSLLPGKGLVRVCEGGCVHVTYGIVTLDFHLREHFESLLVSLAEHPQQPQEPMHLRHGHALVSFSPKEFDYGPASDARWAVSDKLSRPAFPVAEEAGASSREGLTVERSVSATRRPSRVPGSPCAG